MTSSDVSRLPTEIIDPGGCNALGLMTMCGCHTSRATLVSCAGPFESKTRSSKGAATAWMTTHPHKAKAKARRDERLPHWGDGERCRTAVLDRVETLPQGCLCRMAIDCPHNSNSRGRCALTSSRRPCEPPLRATSFTCIAENPHHWSDMKRCDRLGTRAMRLRGFIVGRRAR